MLTGVDPTKFIDNMKSTENKPAYMSLYGLNNQKEPPRTCKGTKRPRKSKPRENNNSSLPPVKTAETPDLVTYNNEQSLE